MITPAPDHAIATMLPPYATWPRDTIHNPHADGVPLNMLLESMEVILGLPGKLVVPHFTVWAAG